MQSSISSILIKTRSIFWIIFISYRTYHDRTASDAVGRAVGHKIKQHLHSAVRQQRECKTFSIPCSMNEEQVLAFAMNSQFNEN